jgi:hypothetical protein
VSLDRSTGAFRDGQYSDIAHAPFNEDELNRLYRLPRVRPVHEPADASWFAPTEIYDLGDVNGLMAFAASAKDRNNNALWGTEALLGATNVRTALAAARDGWQDGARRAMSLMDAHVGSIHARSIRPEPALDLQGESVDVGTYLSGDPECFIRWNETQDITDPAGRVMTVMLNQDCSGGIGRDTFIARGAAALALVHILETAGFSVRVRVMACAQYRTFNKRIAKVATLKESDQPSDYARLAFWLAHPASFRVLNRMGSYGTFGEWDRAYPCQEPASVRGDITIEHAHAENYNWHNPAKALSWIAKTLAAQGVEISLTPQASATDSGVW